PGTHGGQFQGPVGMAIDQRTGFVYVADAGNARIEVFNARSHFRATWGWGVTDGQSKSEVCRSTKGCQAGVPGSGAGQFVFPTSVAVDPSSRTVYVGDAGTNLVQKFSRTGIPLATIDGSTTPQGPFVALAGIAVDQNGNLWTADVGTGNVDEFDSHGTFVQQWSQSSGGPPSAIAVDATNDAVYLLQFGTTNRYTQTGANGKQIDAGSGVALGLNPLTGDLYVDHGHDVA